MSVGPRTRTLTRITSEGRRYEVASAYAALTQVCADTGDNPAQAELVGEHPHHTWWLPASNALALVDADADEAGALLRGARLLHEHRVAAVAPYYDQVRIALGRAVTFWRSPGHPLRDVAASARLTETRAGRRSPPQKAGTTTFRSATMLDRSMALMPQNTRRDKPS
ncbi:hypothetical protein ACFY2K_24600 [Kitasatospora sp. NPDC001309]|uniref:hypothetical protein n=1 Tax=Kitasatospora sp. NPDC001309 TaxID=3364013 RepID=UPI003694A227